MRSHRWRFSRWQKYMLAVFIILLILLFAGLVAVAYLFSDTVTSCAPVEARVAKSAGASRSLDDPSAAVYQPVTLTTADGLTLQAAYAPSQNGAAVIILHGYRASHLDELPVGSLLIRHGYGVLLLDLRCHGGSQGERVTFGKDEVLDADAAYQYLAQQPGIDPRRVGIYGNSLGGATAILYSADNPAMAATVALSPFPSIRDIIQVNTRRALPTPPILLTPFINLWMQARLGADLDDIAPVRHIGEIAPRPLLMMIAGQDVMTDPQAEQRMFAIAGEPKELWYEPQGQHANFQAQFPDEFERRVIEFFDRYLLVLR